MKENREFRSSISPQEPGRNSGDLSSHSHFQPYSYSIHVFWWLLLLEGSLAVTALSISACGFYDRHQPLLKIDGFLLRDSLLWGGLATIPLASYLLLFHFVRLPFWQPLRDVIEQELVPLFKRLTWFQAALVALFAGFSEELLFRWVLQGGLQTWIGGTTGAALGLLLASLLFGICHWVNKEYAMTTFLVGIYFGLLMIWSGTFLVPAVSHFLFDWIAIIYIVKWARPVVPISKG